MRISAQELVWRMLAFYSIETNTREVGEAIEVLKLDGHLIGSTSSKPAGYAFCLSIKEYEEMSRCNLRRAISTLKSYYAPMKTKSITLDLFEPI